MTVPQNVADAVRYGNECWDDGSDPDEREMWQTIRAHLMSQEAEIADLIGKRDFLLRHYNLAESRLAAANALLREIDRNGVLSQGVRARITDYMQGAGDEAV